MARVNDPGEISKALAEARTIAVVGLSPDASRPSNSIARYLIREGYEVIPVNPGFETVLDRRSYPDLLSIPAGVAIDIVDVFRRSEFVAAVADEAIARKVGFVWLQDGVVDRESARRLNEAGIPVAMDRCIYRDREARR